MNVKLSPSHVAILRALQEEDATTRSTAFAAIMSTIKRQYGIPDNHKLRTGSDDHNDADYPTLYRKKTGEAYLIDGTTGQWVGAVSVTAEGVNAQQAVPAAPVARPERSRWFAVNEMSYRDDMVDDVVGTLDFNDGYSALGSIITPFTLDGQDYMVDNGVLYIRIGERAFD